MEKMRRSPAARVRFRAGRGRFGTWVLGSALGTLAACQENLSAPPAGTFGPDVAGPLVQLNPARITLAVFKHTSFRYYARSSDIVDHETVTDTVTVTVR